MKQLLIGLCQACCLLVLIAPTHGGDKACLAPAYTAGVATGYSLQSAFPSLPATPQLVQLLQAPGDGDHWIAVSQRGEVWRFPDRVEATVLEPILDWRQRVDSFGESGLLGLAFHPGFAAGERSVFLYYSPSARSTRLSRFKVDDHWRIEPASEAVLLDIPQPHINHNGGGLVFGPDGYLYLSLGDGGGGDDRYGHGQNTGSLLAAMLRLDVDNGEPYGIPADNPFADGVAGRPEIYAWGLRNTWRFSFDRATGELWGGDVGQAAWEEVNPIERGGNYGWPLREASHCRSDCDADGLQAPLLEYPHRAGDCAVIGGHVYRGDRYPALAGQYVYGDFCSGKISVYDPVAGDSRILALAGFRVSAFAEDKRGETLLLNLDGGPGESIYRLVAGGVSMSPVPPRLSEHPCFSAGSEAGIAAGAVEYQLAVTAWNDGLRARYFYSLPPGEMLMPGFGGDLLFPRRSVLIKNLYAGEQLLETQLLMHHYSGWSGYNYLWNAAGTDAELVTQPHIVSTVVGQHAVTSSGQCRTCHNPVARGVLGADIIQFANVTAGDKSLLEQLSQLGQLGLYEYIPATMKQTLAAADAQSASLGQQARSYLHVNCSGCHRPGGAVSGLDLRALVPLGETGACGAVPTQSSLGVDNALIIAPGDRNRSLLYLRLLSAGPGRMPPLGVARPDTQGAALIGTWIDQLESCQLTPVNQLETKGSAQFPAPSDRGKLAASGSASPH